MLRKYIIALAAIPFLSYAQIPENYYAGTEDLTGYALKTKLHEIISAKMYNWSYDDLKTLYAQTDLDHYYENDGTVLDIYSEIPDGPDAYNYTLDNIVGSAGAEGLGWNREHMMPQSTFNGNYPMYSDLFYVIPADARVNQLRSNYPYGKAGSTVYYNFTNGSKQASNGTPNATYTGRVYEPIDEFKGDIARTLFYFATKYEGKLGTFNFSTNSDPTKDQNPLDGTEEKAYADWYVAMLLSWNQQDPVSQREIDRNNAVYNIQKNRNPFIDHPEWINMIWNQTPDSVAPTAPSSLSLSKNSAYFVNLTWQPSSETDVIGYRIYQDNVLVGVSKINSISIDHLTPNTTYNFTVKAYDTGYLESQPSNTINVTTLESDIYAKDLQIVKYLEGTGDNKAIEIANRTGHSVNLSPYKLYIQRKSGTNYYFDSPFELDGMLENNQSVVVINPNANFSCFDISNAGFVTASPPMTFTGTQYVDLSYKSATVDAVGIKGQDNSLANKSLYRISGIIDPTVNYTESEWISYASNYCQNLGILAVNDVADTKSQFSIYPNPVSDILNINENYDNVKVVKIYDLSGKLVKTIQNPFKNKKSINVHSLQPNIYILVLGDKSIRFIKR